MPAFSRIVIAGVGLIGGSIGKAARERGLAGEVVGLVRSEESAERARKAGVVDRVTTDPAEACAGADLVVLCTPVGAIVETLETLLPLLPADAIVTDGGSTKASIVRGADALLSGTDQGQRFVGSHPLAGDHRTGPEAARGDLFTGKTVVVTPSEVTDTEACDRVTAFWQQLGATVSTMPAGAHDALVAETSHLPHLMASLLAAHIGEASYQFIASGWRDTTRVASGDPGLWVDIFRENRVEVKAAAEFLRERLDHVIDRFEREDWSKIKAILSVGKQRRDAAEEALPANDANERE